MAHKSGAYINQTGLEIENKIETTTINPNKSTLNGGLVLSS
jgi:hypothetical protein